MPYFKDNEGIVHFIEDVIFESRLPDGYVLVKDYEEEEHCRKAAKAEGLITNKDVKNGTGVD